MINDYDRKMLGIVGAVCALIVATSMAFLFICMGLQIHGNGTWQSNPWVWVIEHERVK